MNGTMQRVIAVGISVFVLLGALSLDHVRADPEPEPPAADPDPAPEDPDPAPQTPPTDPAPTL